MRCGRGEVAAVNQKQTGASNRKHRPAAMSRLVVGRPTLAVAYFDCDLTGNVITKGRARSRYRIDRCGWATLGCRKIYPEQHLGSWRYVQTDGESGT